MKRQRETAERVLLIVRTGMGQGGADKVTLTLLQELDRREFRIHLALLRAHGELLEDVPEDVRIHDLRCWNLATMPVPLMRVVRGTNPDIVFSTSSGTNVPSVVAGRKSGRKPRLVLSERNVIWHGKPSLNRTLLVLLKRFFYPYADHHAAVSAGVREDMVRRLRLDPGKITVVYNPVVSAEISKLGEEPVSHPWFSEEVPIILAAGRLVPQKDFPTLLRAFQIVRRVQPARLFILGEGPLRTELEGYARSLGIAEGVLFAGFDKNPFRYMTRCTAFVLSSVQEGLPGVLIQAMACGAAVISTDCPAGPSEIISEPGLNGLLVAMRDPEAMGKAILELLNDPGRRRRIAERGRIAAQRYSYPVALKAYREVIVGESTS